jgi:hypothetical protein
VLTAKLYNLDSVRGSPEPLEEYENPSSMETQVRWLSVVRNTVFEIRLDRYLLEEPKTIFPL